MPRTRLDVPSVEHLSIVDEEGRVDESLEPSIPPEDLRRLYRTFLLARRFDERMLRLQRQGRIGTFGPIRGHEAAVLGSIYALRATDWLVPYYREWPAYMWRGWPLENLILYYAGYAEGMRVPDGVRDLPLCIPIASQIPHAVGLACATRYKGEDSVTMVYFGDGASSHGDCQEAMNFAGVFQAPLVFFCLNNQWAISLPRAKQTPRADARAEGDRLRLPRDPGGRQRPARLLRGDARGRRARAARRGADADRGPHVPAVAPHHGRRPDEVPRRGRGEGVGGAGAPAPVPAVPRDEGDPRHRRATRRSKPRSTPRSGARSSGPRPGCSGSLARRLRPRLRRADAGARRRSATSSCASSPPPARRRTGNAPDGT